MNPLLTVRDLRTYFDTDAGTAKAVDGVSFEVYPGKTLALVGESGCGKSVTALSVLRLIPQPPGRIASGEIIFDGTRILDLPEDKMRSVRGNAISMIFQEPMTSLNPVFRVGNQIAAAYRLHRGVSHDVARKRAIELLDKVGIASPEDRVDDFPHQMSGGMRQRAMIAMALACEPALLIADEPTTALDVTIQAQILDLLRQLQRETGMAMLLITHDLGVVAETADDVAVMYAGIIVERAPVRELFRAPRHPYTVGLFKSLPSVHQPGDRLHTIKGTVPAATHFPPGCPFHPRCPYVMDVCKDGDVPNLEVGPEHTTECWLYHQEHMASLGRPVGIPDGQKGGT